MKPFSIKQKWTKVIKSSVCLSMSWAVKRIVWTLLETILYFQQYSVNLRKTFWNAIYKQFPDIQIKLLCRNLKQNKISPGPCKSQLEPVLFRHFNKSFDPLAQFPKFCTTDEQIWNTGYLRYGSSALILYKELSSFSIFQSLWVSHWVRHR